MFKVLPASSTKIEFENKLESKRLFNILYYLYFYNGGGVATGDINNDGLTDIFFTANNKGGNKLYLNKGNMVFEDITAKAGVAGISDWNTGVTMADVNADGFLDIYVCTVSGKYGLNGHNELYINNKNNTFTESSQQYGLNTTCFSTQAAFFDFDRDGDLDCYLLNQSHHPYSNIVDTSFRRKFDSSSGDRLFRNDVNVNGKFTDVSKQAGIYQSNLGYGLGLAIGDINNDGWDDVYIGNDFHENDYYYVNNHNGTFSEEGSKHFNHYSRFSMGNDVADYNNDGQLDVVTVDMLPPDERTLKTYGSDENPEIYRFKLESNGYQYQSSRNCLQRNNGSGSSFSETGLVSGISATDWSWAPLFADFDNDGNKDLFVSSGIVKRPVDLDYVRYVSDLQMKKGMNKTDAYDMQAINSMPDGSSHPFLFKGDGKLQFADVSKSWGTGELKGYFNASSYADLDNDGDLDLIINCINAPAVMLQNNTISRNAITVSFKGDSLNQFGIGTKVYLFAGRKMQYQQLMLTRGFQSASDTKLHFGLDSSIVADSILVVWPDQKYQVIKKVAAKPLVVSQKDATGSFEYNSFFPQVQQEFTNVSDSIGIAWKHRENNFSDFNVQYLIPHAQSTRGPKMAVADVNGDGLDDIFLCGASNQSGSLMIQTKEGKFVTSDTALFKVDAAFEDVDAIFFDANNDKHPDLYVVSGGNQFDDGDARLADRLYINDGAGHFKNTPNALPRLLNNKSTVSVADIDKDGDLDLFVGVLANAKKFGLPQTSYLLINDGKGDFAAAPEQVINLKDVGMVTSSSFSDLNGDGWPDLVIAGEWMSIKVFINKKGNFHSSDLSQSTGLWQTLFITDVNGDGFNDILAGNWGHNTKLWAGKNGPCKLYVKDFDNNGSVEQVLAYTIDGKEYTFLPKDELERSVPILKKAYLSYGEVAGKTVQYMFYDLFKDYLELKAETLGSSCFINDGKGNFSKVELPESLQLAPIMSFAKGQNKVIIAGGNFLNVNPYEGRYDAQPFAVFKFNSNSNIEYLPQPEASVIKGQVRDLKWIKLANNSSALIIARNDDSLICFQNKNGGPAK